MTAEGLPVALVRMGVNHLRDCATTEIVGSMRDVDLSAARIRAALDSGTAPDVHDAARLATAAADILRQVATLRGIDETASIAVPGGRDGG